MFTHPNHFQPTHYFKTLTRDQLPFANPAAPLEVDMGCGEGYFLEHMAAQFPERNFLGVERLAGRVIKTSKRTGVRNLNNAKVLRMESAYTLAWFLPTESVSRLHLLCPDPWPKKRHYSRRLVNHEEFLRGLERVLIPQGEFLLKTDDEPYFENALDSFGLRDRFTRAEWNEEDFFYPQTDFERQWLAMGRSIHRARWIKTS